MNPTERLAHFVCSHELRDVPPDVMHEAKRAILNFIALATAASHHDACEMILRTAREMDTAQSARVIGRPERVGPLWAAMLNGVSAHVEDFDDTHLLTLIHPGAPVLPAVMAAAEHKGIAGVDALLASILGIEVALRIGLALVPGHWERGYHLTSTCGTIGAAAGSSRAMALSQQHVQFALGLASTQASGVLGMLGTHAKAFHAGKAASNGLLASWLGRYGFSAAGLEVDKGFARVLSPTQDYDAMLAGLGTQWELRKLSYKPYACGVVAHPAMDGLLRIHARLDLADVSAEVVSIQLSMHPSVLQLMGKEEPSTGLEGKFSIYHCAAVALIDGSGGVAQFTDARVNSADVGAMRQKVSVRSDVAIAKHEARIEVGLTDGTVLMEHIAEARGSASNPLSDEDLMAKARELLEPGLGPDRCEELIEAVWHIEDLSSATRLIEMTVKH